jgi:hypothetical protein
MKPQPCMELLLFNVLDLMKVTSLKHTKFIWKKPFKGFLSKYMTIIKKQG